MATIRCACTHLHMDIGWTALQSQSRLCTKIGAEKRISMRILVVEDERDLNSVIVKKLNAEGYATDACFNGLDALDYIHQTEYDAIVMDLMMPKLNGVEVIKKVRIEHNLVPILLLTAKDSVQDRVTGLDSGADDYLVKPFAFEELLARIRVMTRKSTKQKTNVFTIADLTVNCDTHQVNRGKDEIILSSKEFSILEYLIRNTGIVLSREKIEEHTWNYDYDGGSNIVDVYIRYLRKKIDDNYSNKLIHTIRGRGYVLRTDPPL